MKRVFMFLLGALVLASFSSSWAQCPEEPKDLGICDTLYVEAWPRADTCFIGCSAAGCDTVCINEPGEDFPCFLHLNFFVTHDSNTFYFETEQYWTHDSIATFVVPLAFWHPPAGCVDSVIMPKPSMYGNANWNNLALSPYDPRMKRSIFRDFVDPNTHDTLFNRMEGLASQFQGLEWSTIILLIDSTACAGDSGHGWLSMIPSAPSNRRWWEGSRELLATWTFMVYKSEGCDTAEICFDSIFWPPTSELTFTRHDAQVYYPRHNLPICYWIHDGIVEEAVTGVRWIEGSAEEENIPTSFSVSQNYPNPFNPATEFKFDLPHASHVRIEIFNILGQKVKTLVDERRRAGSHVVDWDGTDERGVEVSSGVYFYRMWTDEFSDIKKMVLLK